MTAVSRFARDPLLLAARGILYVLMIAMGAGILGCLTAMVALFAFQNQIVVHLSADAPGLDFIQFRWMVELVLLLVVALLAMLLRMFLLLKRIVDTVGEGDPFVPDNATRLTQMAWLSLAVQIASLPITGLGIWIQKVAEGAGTDGRIHVDGGLVGNGLLLMLILFILARVFRRGAEMRAELEGTV